MPMQKRTNEISMPKLNFQMFSRDRSSLFAKFITTLIGTSMTAMGRPLDDEEIGRVTWHVWFDKTRAGN
jgi:hypothetical protein